MLLLFAFFLNWLQVLLKELRICYLNYPLKRNILKEVQEKLKNNEKLPFFNIPNNFRVSQFEKKYLDKIVKLCQDNDIKLILINTPKRNEILSYSKYGMKEFYEFYDNYYYNIDFLDFSRFSLPESDYGDFVHLNTLGAKRFSTYLNNTKMDSLKKKYRK